LAPDDDPEAAAAPQAEDDTLDEQPYGLAGVMAGLAVLLVLCAFLPRLHAYRQLVEPLQTSILLLTVMLVAISVYIALLVARVQLPVLPMSIVAAELGLLISQPAGVLYAAQVSTVTYLLAEIIAAGLAGYIVAAFLERQPPRRVIAISFLLIFVVVNGAQILMQLVATR
jgi:hypothetical protein